MRIVLFRWGMLTSLIYLCHINFIAGQIHPLTVHMIIVEQITVWHWNKTKSHGGSIDKLVRVTNGFTYHNAAPNHQKRNGALDEIGRAHV